MRVCLVLLFCCSGVSSQFNYFTSLDEGKTNDWVDPKNSFISTISYAVDGMLEKGKEAANIISDQLTNFSGNRQHTENTRADTCRNERADVGISFLSRFINIVLRNTGLKEYSIAEGEENKVVTVDISVTRKSLDILQKFANGDKVPFHELDESFVSLFDISKANPQADINNNFFNSFDFKLLLGLVLAVVVAQLFSFIKRTMTMSLFIFILFVVYYTVCIGQSLWIQYEDAYAKQIVLLEESMDPYGNLKIPDACFPSRLNFWDRIKNSIFWTDDTCKRYMDSKKSLFSQLNFEEALTKPLYGLFFQAIPNFGLAAGKALQLFTGFFGFPLNIILPIIITYLFFKCNFYLVSHFLWMNRWRPLRGLRDFPNLGVEERIMENRTQLPSSGPVYHITNPSTVNISSYGDGSQAALASVPNVGAQQSFLNYSHLPDLFNKTVECSKNIERKDKKQNTDKKYVNYLRGLKSLKELKRLRRRV